MCMDILKTDLNERLLAPFRQHFVNFLTLLNTLEHTMCQIHFNVLGCKQCDTWLDLKLLFKLYWKVRVHHTLYKVHHLYDLQTIIKMTASECTNWTLKHWQGMKWGSVEGNEWVTLSLVYLLRPQNFMTLIPINKTHPCMRRNVNCSSIKYPKQFLCTTDSWRLWMHWLHWAIK